MPLLRDKDHPQTHFVLVVLVQIDAALLRGLPVLRDRVVGVGLVDDLGNQLRPLVDRGRVRHGDVSVRDGIAREILEQERQERVHASNQQPEYRQNDDHEDDGTFAHRRSARPKILAAAPDHNAATTYATSGALSEVRAKIEMQISE